jgi:crotonobetainyl-CoA:carnitine CoA-transferase CaiB-like acyl-CoA transferase
MLDTIFSILESGLPVYTMTGKTLNRTGYVDPATSPYDMYQCKDGYLVIACANDNTFQRLCQVMGKPDLPDNPDFSNNDLRCKNRTELTKIITSWTRTRSKEEIEPVLIEEGVPVASVLTIDQAASLPQIAAREMLVEVKHPTLGNVRLQGVPIKLYGTPGSVSTAAPILGQHNHEVLTSLGITPERIKELESSGII